MRLALGVLLFCWFGPYLLFNDGAIRKDFSIRAETTNVALIPTTDRKCNSFWGLFHQCSYNYELDGTAHSQNYNMFAFGSPKTIILLQAEESGRVTSSTGQEYLWNRLFTVIFGMLLSLATLVGVFVKLARPSPSQISPEQAYLERMHQQQGRQNSPTSRPAQAASRSPRGSRGPTGFGTRTGFSH